MDHAKTRLGRLLLAGALAAPLQAAADDMFLRLDGIRGESLDEKHKGEIDILSYSHSWTGSDPYQGTDTRRGKACSTPVSLTKFVDASSPDLFLAVASEKVFPRAVITFRRPGGQNQFEYFRVTIDNVIVTSVVQSGSPGPGRATENVSLLGTRYQLDYLQSPTGKAPPPRPGWDCAKNKAG